jgi:hypothetical protein
MAKESKEEIRNLLAEREAVFYQARQSATIYVIPVAAVLLGIFLLYIPVEFYKYAPPKLQEITFNSIKTIKEVHAGFLFIMIGLGLIFKARYSAKHYLHLITNFRILEKLGKSEKKVKSIPIHYLGNIFIQSSLFGKMMGVGKIIIEDKKTGKQIELGSMSDPKKYKLAINEAKQRFAEQSTKALKAGLYNKKTIE